MSEAAATTPEAQLTVAAKGLEKRFGAVAALRRVDLEVPRNHIVAVVGPNGAGKSTLLRILSGLVRPTAGHLSICGQPAGERGGARAHVGFVGHATLLYPELTAHENLLFAARLHGVARPRERATQLLEDVGLSELANRRTRHFSSGSSQRLSIAHFSARQNLARHQNFEGSALNCRPSSGCICHVTTVSALFR